jgi:hypothetical protein
MSAILLGLVTPVLAAPADPWPRTRAERTDYSETSLYDDVTSFLDLLVAKDAPVVVSTIGSSPGGRAIPLVVASSPKALSPTDAREAGKLVVYIQANIHAGEVEGKEAALMLIRELGETPNHPWLKNLVLVVAPIYNIDGNEKLGDNARNRASQDGPPQVGVRENGAGLDLNRDGMKAETPEMRAALEHVYNAWDPAVMLDLHTTNGTRHGYHLTYAPPLNPNTDRDVQEFARDRLLPAVRTRLENERGLKLFDYGNLMGSGERRGWYTFGDEGRFVTNYVGLRNRVSVLSEAASFLPFRARVETTLAFVRAVLDELARQSETVRALTKSADARTAAWGANPETAPALGVRFEFAARPTKEPIPIEVTKPGVAVDHRKAPETLANQELTVYDRYRATRTSRLPSAYLIPADRPEIVALLRRHGIAVELLEKAWRGKVDEFQVESVTSTGRFQGHAMSRLEGQFVSKGDVEVGPGAFVASTAQRLAVLLFQLLEPESLDGAAAWGLFDRPPAVDQPYPILKAVAAVPR